MKKARPIFLLIACVAMAFHLTHCKKDTHFTIKGRLLLSCNNPAPVGGADITLVGDMGSVLFCPSDGPMYTVTDAEGNFEFNVTQRFCGDLKVWCKTQTGNDAVLVADSIVFNQPYDLGALYLKENAFWISSIKTNTAYTAADTLFYNITYTGYNYKDSTYNFITGPFSSGQVLDTTVSTVVQYYKELHGYGIATTHYLLKSSAGIKRAFPSSYIRPCYKYHEMIIDLDR